MFPYRRPGQKKRPKNGINRGKPKGGPPKGVPGSARELLPLLQPATKALAHMLAGRTQQSGQFGHARAILARAERAVAERLIDRLTPAEREEFFEQLARLKLTIADAEIEAEVSAEEAEVPKAAPPPIARERLKEMALALATGPSPGSAAVAERPAHPAVPSPPPAAPARPPAMPAPAAEAPARTQVEPPRPVATTRRRNRAPRRPTATAEATDRGGNGQRQEPEAAPPAPRQRPSDGSGLHLPDGWVLDDEGFVVPRSG